MRKNRNNKYVINSDVANNTLKNVFEACDLEPNTKSLTSLKTWNIVNATGAKVGMWVSVALLVLIICMPLAFLHDHSSSNEVLKVEVIDHYMDKDNGCFVMTLSGDSVYYDGIYAVNEAGEVVPPVEIDEEAHIVKIPFTEGNLNIYISKNDGTYVHAVLSDI